MFTDHRIKTMAEEHGEKVNTAFAIADEVHKDQKRKSGEPYITHPIEVAYILHKIGADSEVVCAALLHDALEDANNIAEVEEAIYKSCGDKVLFLVQAVTKDQNIEDKTEQQAVYFDQIQQAFALDIDVFFIKVADILHNMSTIISLDPERKARWIRELKYDYLPLFSEYFHRIPIVHHSQYHALIDMVQEMIDQHDSVK